MARIFITVAIAVAIGGYIYNCIETYQTNNATTTGA